MKRVVVASLIAVVATVASFSSVGARPNYKKEFDTKYVKKDSTDPTEKTFAEAAEAAKCSVCHGKNAEGKEDKKVRNSYGEALGKIIMKKETNAAKIDEALDKVAGEKADPKDPSSKTFGEMIKEGKLPGGDK